jgi:hypothetical protein
MLPIMDSPQILRVTIEFQRGADPPQGQLLVGQAIYPFAGWLGLAEALERVIGPGTRPGSGQPAATG